ncbi:MAG: hypothetical protein IJF62_06185, partial [Firmicutes bacterium]|nr:hypothetical protein [Bacillota bacterium]
REMHDLERLMQRNQEALERLLDESAQKAFERYNNAVREYQLLSIEQAFGDGFAVGIMLLAEASSRAERLQD